MKLELWIGIVEMTPLDRNEYGAAGAFTSVVTWARDREGFCQKAEVIAAALEMLVADVEGAQPLATRLEKQPANEEIADMVLRAEVNPDAIVYGTFHRYRFYDA